MWQSGIGPFLFFFCLFGIDVCGSLRWVHEGIFLFKLIFVMMVFFFNLIHKHGGLGVEVGNWDGLCRSVGIFFIVY